MNNILLVLLLIAVRVISFVIVYFLYHMINEVLGLPDINPSQYILWILFIITFVTMFVTNPNEVVKDKSEREDRLLKNVSFSLSTLIFLGIVYLLILIVL